MSAADITASPLSWPHGRPRTSPIARKPAPFGKAGSNGYGRASLSVADASLRLMRELVRADACDITISTNLELRLDGIPRSGRPEPDDPGAAVYFVLDGRPIALACDKWDTVADNIAAIAKHVESLRGQERWGVGSMAQAFAGFVALPPPASGEKPQRPWREVFGFRPGCEPSLATLSAQYRQLASERRDDEDALRELNVARDEARKEGRT